MVSQVHTLLWKRINGVLIQVEKTQTFLSHRLYPVDKTRVNEYGVSYDEEPKRKAHKE